MRIFGKVLGWLFATLFVATAAILQAYSTYRPQPPDPDFMEVIFWIVEFRDPVSLILLLLGAITTFLTIRSAMTALSREDLEKVVAGDGALTRERVYEAAAQTRAEGQASQQRHEHTHRAQAEQARKLDDIDERIRRIEASTGSIVPGSVLRETVIYELEAKPGADDRQLADAVRALKAENEDLRRNLEKIEVFDNQMASLKADAEQALAKYEHREVAAIYGKMRDLLREKTIENMRRDAGFAREQGRALLAARDWAAAADIWELAAKEIEQFDEDEAGELRSDAARELYHFGERYGGGSLAKAIDLIRPFCTDDRLEPNIRALWLGRLGSSLNMKGQLQVEKERDAYLGEAIKTYKSALHLIKREDDPRIWAWIQSGLGNTLTSHSLGKYGFFRRRVLRKAVHAFEEALRVTNKEREPIVWAGIKNNLGIAKDGLSSASHGSAIARERDAAISEYRAALCIYTRDNDPDGWANAHANLAGSLRRKGSALGGVKGKKLISESIDIYQLMLKVEDRDTWPLHWAMTQEDLGLALEALADLSPSMMCDHLAVARGALSASLEVFDERSSPFNFKKASRSLTRVEEKIAQQCS
ncbi:hypothetical protein [Citromicrobium sp. JLT1363]|uniref:hypothetical protein n=1 Tax=Citromicrobium sp. JLT1363 TaxID=517722 RepID=UPI000225EBC3|nr:hypothetical protein [Citromicrobium sp. JLT1363]